MYIKKTISILLLSAITVFSASAAKPNSAHAGGHHHRGAHHGKKAGKHAHRTGPKSGA